LKQIRCLVIQFAVTLIGRCWKFQPMPVFESVLRSTQKVLPSRVLLQRVLENLASLRQRVLEPTLRRDDWQDCALLSEKPFFIAMSVSKLINLYTIF
jgi:hypothetical protein